MNSSKLIDFGNILKKSWQCVRKYKYLWLLGILTGGGLNAGSNNINYIFDSSNQKQDWQSFWQNHNFSQLSDTGKVLGASDYSLSTNMIITIAVLGFILAVVFIYLQVTARGAIISAVDEINRGENFTLGQSWRAGHKCFWRILLYTLLLMLIMIIPLAVLAIPVAIMASIRWYVPAIIVGLVFALIFIVYAIYIALIVQYGERILVIENKGPWESFITGSKFFRMNWKNVLITYLINIAIAVVAGIAIVISSLIVFSVLFGIVYGIYFINLTAAIIVAIPFGLAVFAALLIIGGILSAFQSSFVTLSYKEIKNLS